MDTIFRILEIAEHVTPPPIFKLSVQNPKYIVLRHENYLNIVIIIPMAYDLIFTNGATKMSQLNLISIYPKWPPAILIDYIT